RARIVRDGHVAAGQTAEDDALADVWLADESDPQRTRAQRQRSGRRDSTFVGDVTGHFVGGCSLLVAGCSQRKRDAGTIRGVFLALLRKTGGAGGAARGN